VIVIETSVSILAPISVLILIDTMKRHGIEYRHMMLPFGRLVHDEAAEL
jgi:hypothetical protein